MSALQRVARAGGSALYRIGNRPQRDPDAGRRKRGRARRFICNVGGLGCIVAAGGIIHIALGVALAGVAFFVFDALSTEDDQGA